MTNEKKRILIIDSDRRVRQDIALSLQRENYNIETGKGLHDAIKKLSEGCFGCLVLDVDLPEMKGYEAVSLLKNIDPEIKIIITSKKNTKRLEARVRDQDIFFYFIKSFGKEELKLAINSALTK